MPARAIDKIILIGLLGLLFLVPFFSGGAEEEIIYSSQFLILLLLALLVAKFLREGEIRWRRTSLDLPLLLLAGWSLLSTFFSVYRYVSLSDWGLMICQILTFYLVLSRIEKDNEIALFIFLLIALASSQAWYSYYQRGRGIVRVPGTFFNPNFLAGYLVIGISLSLSLLFNFRLLLKGKVVLILVTGFMLGSLFLTASRAGGLIFLVALIVLTAGSYFRGKKKGALVLLLILVLFFLVPNPFMQRLLEGTKGDVYAYKRFPIWLSSWKMIVDRSWGWGLGSYDYVFDAYNFPVEGTLARFGKRSSMAHNEYLQIGAELGIPGLLLFLALIFIFARDAFQTWKKSTPGFSSAVQLGILSSLVAVFVHSFLDFNLHIPAIGYTVSVLGAIGLRQSERVREVRIRFSVKKIYYILLVIITLVIGMVMVRPMLASRLLVRGEGAFQQGKMEEAVKIYRQAISWNSLNSIYHANLGLVYWAQYLSRGNLNQATSAIRELEEAINLNPRVGGYYQQLGIFYYQIYRRISHPQLLEKAISLRQTVLRYQPYQPFIRLDLARIYYENNYQQQARQELEKLVNIEPNYLAAHYYLGVIYQEMGELEVAKKQYLQAHEILEKNLVPVTQYEKKLLEFDSRQLYDKLNFVKPKN